MNTENPEPRPSPVAAGSASPCEDGGAVDGARGRLWGRLGFPVRFLLLSFVFQGLAAGPLEPVLLPTLARAVAVQSGAILTVTGETVRTQGPVVSAPEGSWAFRIVADCTPLVPGLLYGAAVLAFPAGLRARLLGLAAGAGFLWLANLGRIVALYGVHSSRPELYDRLHETVGQGFVVAAAAAAFVVFTLSVRRSVERSDA